MSAPTYENGRLVLVLSAIIDEHGAAHAVYGFVDLATVVEVKGRPRSTVDSSGIGDSTVRFSGSNNPTDWAAPSGDDTTDPKFWRSKRRH